MFRRHGEHLYCRLPSGRLLCYPFCNLSAEDNGIEFMGVDSVTHRWGKQSTYGGKLAENITQAICRDLMAEAILRLESKNHPVVLTVHDEVVVEVEPAVSLSTITQLMTQVPNWASGFPIDADGWEGSRYQK
jgi:DNA polymerase